MMRPRRLLPALCLLAGIAHAKDAPVPVKLTMADILKTSTPAEWRTLNPDNTLYLELDAGRVVIELAPDFAPKNVANIKTLVGEAYFDGLAIVRSHENYVAQWADPDEKRDLKSAATKVAGEFTVGIPKNQVFTRLPDVDGYASQVGHVAGMAAGRDPLHGKTWLVHCYAAVGVARGNESDSGNGSSLYVVTGHAPRQLDRNITVVGRVRQGMELLTTLPRGTAALGFYEKPEQRTPIKSIKLASSLPAEQQSPLEVLRTESASFKNLVAAQRNRGGDWYKVPAGHIELCNVPLPVRVKP